MELLHTLKSMNMNEFEGKICVFSFQIAFFLEIHSKPFQREKIALITLSEDYV